MHTKLDQRSELTKKINCLSASEIQKLKIFISGMEASKAIESQNEESKQQQENPSSLN